MNSFLSRLSSVLFGNSKHCQKRCLTYGSVAALTVVLEELFECVIFRNPCEGHIAYGLTFLWFPILLLFLPGILHERRLKRRKADEDSQQTPTHRYLKTLFDILEAFIRVSIAPVAWLVLSFMQQRYYACAHFGPPLESAAATSNKSDKCYFILGARSGQLEKRYKTRSQIVGWWLMVIAMFILFTSICIRRCIKKGKRLRSRLPSVRCYRHVAAKEASEQFHTKAKELAKQKAKEDVESFLQNTNNSDYDACIEEASEKLRAKYGKFFFIPPESPWYNTVVDQSDRPPQSSEMFFDQTDGDEWSPLNNGGRRESQQARTHGSP